MSNGSTKPRRNIAARRRLKELYTQGVAVRFGPDGPEIAEIGPPHNGHFPEPLPEGSDTIEVWVAPPNPLQRDEAMRAANGARAAAMLRIKRDKTSEEYLTSLNFLSDMSDETLIDYVLLTTQEERKNEAIRDVLGEKEWADFTHLQDAMREFEERGTPQDDPDFAALLERDAEYGQQVNERFMSITEAARDLLRGQPRAKLEEQGMEKRAMLVGSERFMEAYERHMTFYSIRDAGDHDELWFDDADELREADDIVQQTFREAIESWIQDGTEAKNSPGAAAGSSLSPLPSEQEIFAASTPEAASA